MVKTLTLKEMLKICSMKKKNTEGQTINQAGKTMTSDREDKNKENYRFLRNTFTRISLTTVMAIQKSNNKPNDTGSLLQPTKRSKRWGAKINEVTDGKYQ